MDFHETIQFAHSRNLQRFKTMKQLVLIVVTLISIVQVIHAQPSPAATELTKLLKDFLDGASRNDLAAHERFWADDLIYTSSTGRRISKADILREVRQTGAPKPGEENTVYSAEDVRIQQYDNTAIVAFRLVGTTEKAGKKE